MKVFLVDLEVIESRYTYYWKNHIPNLLMDNDIDVTVIAGPDLLPENQVPGAFLNFGSTNVYKAEQLRKLSNMFCENKISSGDYILFTDFWNPTVINVRYMAALLGIDVQIGGLVHAGHFDPNDFLGRVNGKWLESTEETFYHTYDHLYFATNYIIDMFCRNTGIKYDPIKMIKTGWPMEYTSQEMLPYRDLPKENLILFPHRIAPEKQVEIFRDLAYLLPQYEFVVCQDQQLSKSEYHTLLGRAKLVFSASKQETLGIAMCFDAPHANAIPLCPDRLSYSEIFEDHPEFLYPSEWTSDIDSYVEHKIELIDYITYMMESYDSLRSELNSYIEHTAPKYGHATRLLAGLGSPYANAIPLCPDRLIYSEIVEDHPALLYPSEWTLD